MPSHHSMPSFPMPADLFALQMKFVTLAFDAHSVVALRVLGAAGLWPVSPRENGRMVSEKSVAFAKSAEAASAALFAGQRPDQVLDAAVGPYGRKARANARRLSRGTGR